MSILVDLILKAVGPVGIPFFAVAGTPEAASTRNVRPAVLDAATNALHVLITNPSSMAGLATELTLEAIRALLAARFPAALVNARLAVNADDFVEVRFPVMNQKAIASSPIALSTGTFITPTATGGTSKVPWRLFNAGPDTVYFGPNNGSFPLSSANGHPLLAGTSITLPTIGLTTTHAICAPTKSATIHLLGWNTA